jgi:hypothetical protein
MTIRRKSGRPAKGLEFPWAQEEPIIRALIRDGWGLARLSEKYGLSIPALKKGLRKFGLVTQGQVVHAEMVHAYVQKQLTEEKHDEVSS